MIVLLSLMLSPTPTYLPPDPPVLLLLDRDDHDHQGRGHKDHGDKDQKHARKEQEKEWRKWAKHHDDDERGDRDWDFDHPRHRHLAPPWMDPWWGARRGPRYVAVVPNDPTRCYVFLDGRWVLRRVRDVGFQADIDDVMRLPAAPPPVPLPPIGLDLHVVLFN